MSSTSAATTATTATTVNAYPVCQYGGQPSTYHLGFRVYINGHLVLNIYYNNHVRHLMIMESTQLGTHETLYHYESPLATLQRLYNLGNQQLPTLNAAGGTPYEYLSWYELLDTYGHMTVRIQNPIFYHAPTAVPYSPLRSAPLFPRVAPNAPLRAQPLFRRNLFGEEPICRKRLIDDQDEVEQQDEVEPQDEPADFLELRSGTKIPKY